MEYEGSRKPMHGRMIVKGCSSVSLLSTSNTSAESILLLLEAHQVLLYVPSCNPREKVLRRGGGGGEREDHLGIPDKKEGSN